eukprot:SAG11_NODE_1951_length_4011_cov_5.799080_3_plen_82_part_00
MTLSDSHCLSRARSFWSLRSLWSLAHFAIASRHQDYHCAADIHDRSQLMVHVFNYFSGLNGSIGDLIVMPRTQYPPPPFRG